MAPKTAIQNIDLMKDYFRYLLNENGLHVEAGRLEGVVIRSGNDARVFAEIIRNMTIPQNEKYEILRAKKDLLKDLEAAYK